MSKVTIREVGIFIEGTMHRWSHGEQLPPDLHGVYVKVDGPEWVDFNELTNSNEHVLLVNGLIIDVALEGDRYVSDQCPGWWDRFGAHKCAGIVSYGGFNINKRRKGLTVGIHNGNEIVYVGKKHALAYVNGCPVVLDLNGRTVGG
jgi:hypothetical protein